MGQKKIIKQTTEEVLKEGKSLETTVKAATSKSVSKKFERGRVYINATFNNTGISVTDDKGNLIAWSTAGSLGFAGPKKATPFAASKIVSVIAEKVKKSGPHNVDVLVNGVGGGRDSSIRSLTNHGFSILSIKDVTPIPHNGPRPPKVRRV